ncbi:MAG: (Fe-S)-binding protein, partial [Deltaproteobacteria bacterium]|nr:(Fe-S)-binding protein [Deltaproteobacteria bacterium]
MEAEDKENILARLAERLNQSVRLYMDNCSRCGVCIEACHAYASTGDIRYSAVGRAQNIRRLYENYHTITGKIAPWLNDAAELDTKWMDRVYETAFTCTGCRRCMVYCPFGIDTQQIQNIAKAMLIEMDMDPKPLTMRAKNEISKGDDLDTTRQRLQKELDKIRNELVEEHPSLEGRDVIPIDVQGANVLFVSMAEKPSI